ncbi:MAG: DUF2132 domain-containing protein [Gemmatimonadetes bacterium]|nr:DUF2132 domain-containing protein [Gemmatimonadota bacterium]
MPGESPLERLRLDNQPNNPLHGLTLETIVRSLVDHSGWKELGERVPINCFLSDPSVRSSLTFLRRTTWARARVEELYVTTFT